MTIDWVPVWSNTYSQLPNKIKDNDEMFSLLKQKLKTVQPQEGSIVDPCREAQVIS